MKKSLFTILALVSTSFLSAQTLGDVVDMGLSVKWHSCNYEAEKPSDKGTTYAFADTNAGGYSSNYMYPYFSYMTYAYNLPTENIAGTSMDAAFVGSEGACRMPTNEEWEELFENCTIVSSTMNDVDGKLFTSKINGNSIFMPYVRLMMGYDYVTSIYYYGGTATSSSIATVATPGLSSSQPMVLESFRNPYVGLPIRPVEEVDASELTGIELSADKTELFVGTMLQLSATPIPEDSRISGAVWTSSNSEIATVTSKGVVLGLASGTVTISVESKGIVQSIELTVIKVDTPSSEEYVDLGLSVKWSARNLGAASNAQFGDRYPWGYITPEVIESNLQYKFFNKTSFQYKLPAKDICGNIEYDAVAAATDDNAMIASADQYQELIDHCDAMATTLDGQSGLLLTSRQNGKSIFFPTNGSTTLYYTGNANDALSAAKIFRIDSPNKIEITQNSIPYQQNYLRGVMPFTDTKLESLSMDVEQLSLYTLNTYQLTLTASPISYLLENIEWKSSDDDIALVTAKGLVIARNPGIAIITATVDGISATCEVTVSDISVTEGAAVDMGTEVLWATHNIGANEPYEIGQRYSFGAIEPNTVVYDYPENIRGTEYDVVHTTMGENWYMPTPDDFTKLIENTEMEWVNWENTQGALLISKVNGNRIFFPVNQLGQVYYNTSMLNPQRDDITIAYRATEQGQELGGLSTSTDLPVRGICITIPVGASAIEDVDELSDIFTFNGILVKRAATRNDIEALPSGFYIIAGNKYIKK